MIGHAMYPIRTPIAAGLVTIAASMVSALACGSAMAEQAGVGGVTGQAPPSITTVSPIFSQLLVAKLPAGFKLVKESTSRTDYLRELVPDNESADQWTQMVTVTGAKGAAHRPGISAMAAANAIASGFARACPGSYSGLGLGDRNVSGFAAYLAYAACGVSPSAKGTRSEAALLLVIVGQDDIYTVQFAERAAPSAAPPRFAPEHWAARLAALAPLRLCAIVPGESAPYASCLEAPK